MKLRLSRWIETIRVEEDFGRRRKRKRGEEEGGGAEEGREKEKGQASVERKTDFSF